MKRAITILLAFLLVFSLASAFTALAASPLDGISYYGGRNRCVMTSAQAKAYAAAVDSLPKNGSRAALVDVAGDGFPLLVTISDYSAEIGADYTSVWEYRDGKAVKYNFSKDGSMFDAAPQGFSVGTIYGKGVLCAASTGGGGVNRNEGELFYQVEKSRLTLNHTIWKVNGSDPATYIDGKLFAKERDEDWYFNAPYKIIGWEEQYVISEMGSDLFIIIDTTPAADAAAALAAYAEKAGADVNVKVMGAAVVWQDAKPFINGDDRTMVPLRAVGEALGLTVEWLGSRREASFSDGTKTLYFHIDSKVARTGDGRSIVMDTAAVIVNDRTYAPVRYLAEYFGYTVEWDGASRTVIIK